MGSSKKGKTYFPKIIKCPENVVVFCVTVSGDTKLGNLNPREKDLH